MPRPADQGGLRTLSGALLALAAFLAAPPASATEPRLSVSAHPIFGTEMSSPWTELVVDVQNTGNAVDGTIELVADDDGARNRVVYRREIAVGAEGPTRVHVPAYAGAEYEVRFVPDGAALLFAAQHVSVPDERASIVLSSGVRLPTSEVPKNGVSPRQLWQTWVLPKFAATYDNVVLYVVRDSLPRSEDDECAALRAWVHDGGSVVIAATAAPQRWIGHELACGLGTIDKADAVASVESAGVRAGNGFVRILPADSLQSPDVVHELYTAAMRRAPGHSDLYSLNPIAPGDYQPALSVAGSALFGFALLSGPLLFARLRRRKKTERVLVALPSLSLATFASLMAFGACTQRAPHTTTRAVREHANGETVGRALVARTFHRPPRDLRVTRAVSGSLVPSPPRWMNDDIRSRGSFSEEADGRLLLNHESPANDYVYLVESGESRLAGAIAIACRREACTITNESGAPLTGARLRTPHGLFDVGTVERTATASLEPSRLRNIDINDPLDAVLFHARGGIVELVGRQRVPGDDFDSISTVTCTGGCEATQ